MSADLWAAFGDGEDATSNPWAQPSPTDARIQSQKTAHTRLEAPSNSLIDASIPQISEPQKSPAVQSPWGTEATFSPVSKPSVTGFLVDTAHDEPDTEEADWTDFAGPSNTIDPWATARSQGATEVLWDADQTNEDEDEFGDFEAPSKGMSSLAIQHDIGKSFKDQSFDDKGGKMAPASSSEQMPIRGRSVVKPNPLEGLNTKADSKQVKMTSTSNKGRPVKAPDSKHKGLQTAGQLSPMDEEWDEWSPDPVTSTQFSSQAALKPTPKSSTSVPSKPSKSPPRSTSRSSSQPRLPPISTLPPTNIPPPSILISLLATLISTLPAQVEKAMTAFTTNPESNTAADRALSTAVRKCLAALRVAARIVAGRKLRWKRDTHLSQSMRIGPASAAGKGGMKLTGIDRNEIKREDREVAEFVRVWQAKLGSVRRALASVNSRIGDGDGSGASKKLELPSIAETMLVRTLKDEDGGVRSAKGCTLCGIKREERVDKVDGGEAFDVSSEWWVEHWGHRECRAFWYQHEKYLQQR